MKKNLLIAVAAVVVLVGGIAGYYGGLGGLVFLRVVEGGPPLPPFSFLLPYGFAVYRSAHFQEVNP